MSDERSNRITDLYDRALAQAPEERERFLHDACGDDDALRREVESLLELEPASEKFLERPAAVILDVWRTHEPVRRRRAPVCDRSRH
jgi:eukaryotic-like serine/threonine-protein kinase